jgi:hypothetical protein
MELVMVAGDSHLRRLADRAEIQDVLLRYARGVDRREWDLIRSSFHPDAWDDHGAYRGGVEGLIEWVSRRHSKIGQSMHFLGNCLVEFANDDTALVETYYSALQRLGPEAEESKTMLMGGTTTVGEVDITVLGRYIDRFERRSGVWKIAKRVSLYEAIRTHAVSDPTRNPAYDWAERDRTDKLFEMKANVFGGR